MYLSFGKAIIPEKVWQSDLMDNHLGSVILQNGYLYVSGSNSRGWFCLDFLTGKLYIRHADKLYAYNIRGN